jgi:hypothetical protein
MHSIDRLVRVASLCALHACRRLSPIPIRTRFPAPFTSMHSHQREPLRQALALGIAVLP